MVHTAVPGNFGRRENSAAKIYRPERVLYSSHFEAPPPCTPRWGVPSSNCFRTPPDGGYQPTKHAQRGWPKLLWGVASSNSSTPRNS